MYLSAELMRSTLLHFWVWKPNLLLSKQLKYSLELGTVLAAVSRLTMILRKTEEEKKEKAENQKEKQVRV